MQVVDKLAPGTIVVSGDGGDVDKRAANRAAACGLTVEKFPARWKVLGRAAGPIRNTEIVAACDVLVAFFDGRSDGTTDVVVKALKAKKLRAVYPPRGWL